MKIYKITEASEYLGVSINTLKTLANNGKIKSFKTTGEHRRFRHVDDRAYLLVTGRAPNMLVRGWLYGKEGKRDIFWANPVERSSPGKPRPCYFVGQGHLRSINDPLLAEIIDKIKRRVE